VAQQALEDAAGRASTLEAQLAQEADARKADAAMATQVAAAAAAAEAAAAERLSALEQTARHSASELDKAHKELALLQADKETYGKQLKQRIKARASWSFRTRLRAPSHARCSRVRRALPLAAERDR
jgi:hypothetical protein